MGAQGQVEVDFGAHPGAIEKEVDVATAGVVATSLVEAWLHPDTTTDHTVDEHIAMMDSLRVQGRYLSDNNIRVRVQPVDRQMDTAGVRGGVQESGINRVSQEDSSRVQPGPQRVLAYGKWVVAWVWNG